MHQQYMIKKFKTSDHIVLALKMVYSQKMKLKDDIVASLNNKLFFLTDSEAFQVVSKKNVEDKRMRLYHLKTPAK